MEKVISSFSGILEIFFFFLVVGTYLFSVSEDRFVQGLKLEWKLRLLLLSATWAVSSFLHERDTGHSNTSEA